MRHVLFLRSAVALLAAATVLTALISAEAETPVSTATQISLPTSAAPMARPRNCAVTA